MIVRKDWLDEADLDIPVTYDDWEKMLWCFATVMGVNSLFISQEAVIVSFRRI